MGDELFIHDNSFVRVTEMNHLVEVQWMQKINRMARIVKIDKYRYMILSTGEVKEFEISTNRSDNYNSLRQTFKRLRYLINNNFTGARNELFLTLTYAENMTDSRRLYDDFRKFFMRFRNEHKEKGSVDYLSVVEPQGRGAWHIHCLLRFNELDEVYIPNTDIARLWGYGFVKVKSLNRVDNVGAYLTAYLADLELDDESLNVALREQREILIKEVDGQNKAFIKGGRLHMYPSGMNLYRKSRGIKMPARNEMVYCEVKKIVGPSEPHYQRKVVINDDKTGFKNTIVYEQYNTKRIPQKA